MRILVDTSVWVRFFDSSSPLCERCRSAIDETLSRGDELCICAQVMIEFWAVATRPIEANGLGMTHEGANLNLGDILEVCTLLPEPPDLAEQWRDLAVRARPTGKTVHDSRIVALMIAHGVEHLLTLNGEDFKSYPGVKAIAP